MPWPQRKKPSRQEDMERVQRCLSEAYPHGPAEDKLRGLIYCLRRRYNGHGYERHAIAQRARISETTVNKVIVGAITDVRWDAYEAVLKALNASHAEITVALSLYEAAWHNPRPPIPASGSPWVALTANWRWDPEPSAPQHPSHRQAPPIETSTAPRPPEPARLPGNAESGDSTAKTPKPDPVSATTAAEFVRQMKAFRVSKGPKSYRDMEKTAKTSKFDVRSYAAASYNTIGKNGKLPTEELLRSYIIAAGGDRADLKLWQEARRRLAAKLEANDPT